MKTYYRSQDERDEHAARIAIRFGGNRPKTGHAKELPHV